MRSSDSKRRIVLADENADMRAYVTRLLCGRWTVEAYADGEAALAAVLARPPDLVLTDVMMPRFDGFGLLRALKSDERTRAIPVILFSARAGEDSCVEGLELGADDYLVKPFSARELVARVATHLELSRTRLEAERQRQHFLSLLMQVPTPISIMRGNELRYEFQNEAHRRVVWKNVVGQKYGEVFGASGDNAHNVERLKRVYETGQPCFATASPLTLPDDDGVPQTRYFNAVIQPWTDDAGVIEGVLTIGFDVSAQVATAHERDELLARERSARERADQASLAKDEFVAMLGHELRNPLSPIVTALQLLRLRGITAREYDVIDRQVQHLIRLVDDLLDVSRITRGKTTLKKRRIELAEAAARALEMAGPLVEQRRQRLDVRVASRGLAVSADLERLAQIIANLLTNASKYSDPGSRIVLAVERAGDRIRIRVRDEGIGIAPEMLGRIFDSFVQQPQSLDRARGGLGLGLSIVKSLVALHGGSVTAKSEGLGKGAEFVVELSVAAALDTAAPGTAVLEATAASHGDAQRVLVVDDNDDLASMLAETLRELGYDVATAPDAPTALAEADRFAPNVAILDIGLPVMDGYELAGRLRARVGGDCMLLLALTGYGQEADRRRAAAAGFDAHFVKPVDVVGLARSIESHTRRDDAT